VHDSDHFFRRRTRPLDERRATASEPSVKRLPRRGDIAGIDHCLREPWPADRLAGVAARFIDERLDVDRHATRAEPFRHLDDARDAGGALGDEKLRQPRISAIEEVGEHMNVLTAIDRRNLDARHKQQRLACGFGSCLVEPIGRIVVGYGEDTNPGRSRMRDELSRGQASVGGCGVEMKVDHSGVRGDPGQRAARVDAVAARRVDFP